MPEKKKTLLGFDKYSSDNNIYDRGYTCSFSDYYKIENGYYNLWEENKDVNESEVKDEASSNSDLSDE